MGIRPDTQYASSGEIAFAPGDLLLLLTDGSEEAMAADNTLFGIDRILEVIRAHREQSAQEMVTALYQAVRQFSGQSPQTDDVTTIVLKVK